MLPARRRQVPAAQGRRGGLALGGAPAAKGRRGGLALGGAEPKGDLDVPLAAPAAAAAAAVCGGAVQCPRRTAPRGAPAPWPLPRYPLLGAGGCAGGAGLLRGVALVARPALAEPPLARTLAVDDGRQVLPPEGRHRKVHALPAPLVAEQGRRGACGVEVSEARAKRLKLWALHGSSCGSSSSTTTTTTTTTTTRASDPHLSDAEAVGPLGDVCSCMCSCVCLCGPHLPDVEAVDPLGDGGGQVVGGHARTEAQRDEEGRHALGAARAGSTAGAARPSGPAGGGERVSAGPALPREELGVRVGPHLGWLGPRKRERAVGGGALGHKKGARAQGGQMRGAEDSTAQEKEERRAGRTTPHRRAGLGGGSGTCSMARTRERSRDSQKPSQRLWSSSLRDETSTFSEVKKKVKKTVKKMVTKKVTKKVPKKIKKKKATEVRRVERIEWVNVRRGLTWT